MYNRQKIFFRDFTIISREKKGFILNPIAPRNLSSIITTMTKADAMAPIVALEGTVVAGRTYQAYKRGKWDEARERFIEESMGSVVWLCGVQTMNKLGDKLVGQILKKPGANFDVGTDKVLRTPFENFMKKNMPNGFSPKQVALIKGAKVLTSIILTNLFIGFVVPKVNQGITKKLRHERRVAANENGDKVEISNNKKNPSFKGGGIAAINTFTNAIENTNTGKLLSSDAGIAGGRMYNARRKEERREVAIRDIGSIYFYMWAQGHVRNILNLIESGHSTRLNPATSEILDKHLAEFLNGREMDVEDFRKAVLGEKVKIPNELKFESAPPSLWEKITKQEPLEVIKLSEFEKIEKNNDIIARAKEMSKLQPKRMGEAVLTKQQVIDSYNKAAINDPKFLNKVFEEFTDGASTSEYKYVSNKKLYNLKNEMEHYVSRVCKAAKNGKVNKKLLDKVQNKNLMLNGLNFAVGFGFASAFLSTYIPKIQYYVTRKTTGVDAFPGVYDYEHHQEEID